MHNVVKSSSAAAALALVAAFCGVAFSRAGVPAPGPSGYHVIKTVSVPGDEGWDYLLVDSDARRVYISHASHTVVMNADTYAIEGDIPDTQGVHGIALVYLAGGLASRGSVSF